VLGVGLSGSPGSAARDTVTINPAAMPAGTEVSFGNFRYSFNNSTDTAIELIDTNSYTCTSTLPAPPQTAVASS
jgi:hypothetical protein